MSANSSIDRRSAAAASRRAKTRAKLIESAILIFAEKGVDASVIDDVIVAAGVSRGTFYNYFISNHELLVAANEQLGNELVELIELEVGNYPAPEDSVATGIRLFLEATHRFPFLGRFVTHVGLDAAGPGNLIYEYLPPNILGSIERGRFLDMPLTIALDLIAGTALMGIFRIPMSEDKDAHAAQVVASILRGLGMSAEDAKTLSEKPVPDLIVASDSLLARSQARANLATTT